MYLVQTVSARPRPWSSYTNINIKEPRDSIRMNGSEEISKYYSNSSLYYSPVLTGRIGGNTYESTAKSSKKDKKWSFGNLFRRKKKAGSESSSEEEIDAKNFLHRRKKRSDKRKRANKAAGFDHVVIPSSPKRTSLTNGYKMYQAEEKGEERIIKNFIPASDFTKDSFSKKNNNLDSPALGSSGRRKREIVMARAEARRDSSQGRDSSDDDESQRSADSLNRQRDGSLNRKSRSARTKRYFKRRSKDEELQDQLRPSKSDADDHYRKLRLADERIHNFKSASRGITTQNPILSYSNSLSSLRTNNTGISTIPTPNNLNKYLTIDSEKRLPFHLHPQRSLSCDISKTSSMNGNELVRGQFHSGKPSNTYLDLKANRRIVVDNKPPPPPPPRDPKRILNIQSVDGRPISYSFENGLGSNPNHPLNGTLPTQQNKNSSLNPNSRSTSEDHIVLEPAQKILLQPRPSSTTPEASNYRKLNLNREALNGYKYLTDKNPRSRRPICIQHSNSIDKVEKNNDAQKPFQFWKRKDEETARTRASANNSPVIFTAQTQVKNNVFSPDGTQVNENREASPFRPITPGQSRTSNRNEEIPDGPDLVERKSTNLEEALDELEAIYNSLHLGDEDLLERAEQREAAAAQKRRDALLESFPNSLNRGASSDSGFGYNNHSLDLKRKRYVKRPEPDRKTDDMAFRKLNKDRFNTVSVPQSVVSKVSYLLTSPAFGNNRPEDTTLEKITDKTKNEPDVTFDDVVYRNLKHTNNTLKVADPQPPFGIPIGPVLLASNNDYLHAMPENTHKYTFKAKKIPDVVKDDLAFRNLRKDPNKEPALPQTNLSLEGYNNNCKPEERARKKRAVRSLSANLFNLMQKGWKENSRSDDFREQSIGDVADALEASRQILREKEDKISATKKAFLSDGELKYTPFEQKNPFLNQMKSSKLSDNETIYHHKLQVNIPVTNLERLGTKPPTPDRSRKSSRPSTKESTPVPNSIIEETKIEQNQEILLNSLLSNLVDEAQRADEKAALSRPIERDKLAVVSERLKELEENTISASLNLNLPQMNSTREHETLCVKLLECVTNDFPDSLEEVAGIDVESSVSESVANIVTIKSVEPKLDVNLTPMDVYSESEHDYVNINCTEGEEEEEEVDIINKSSKNIKEDNTQKANPTKLLGLLEEVKLSSEILTDLESKSVRYKDETDKKRGEENVDNLLNVFSVEDDEAFEPRLDCNLTTNLDVWINEELVLESLKSPKLVLNLNNLVCESHSTNGKDDSFESSNINCDEFTDLKEGLRNIERLSNLDHICDSDLEDSNLSTSNMEVEQKLDLGINKQVNDVKKSSCLGDLNSGDFCDASSKSELSKLDSCSSSSRSSTESQPSRSWYEDPAVMALACSCGVACTTQLPTFDVIAALGLLFVLISLVLSLLTRT